MCLNGGRGLALAAILGAHDYGLFGTLIVLQQYLSYAALGVREGVAIRLAREGTSGIDVLSIYSSSLAWGLGVGMLIVSVFSILHLGLQVVPGHFVLIGLLSLASIVNEILINISRHENKLTKVAGMEFVYQGGALLLVACFWRWMSVNVALLCLLSALLASLFGYTSTLRSASWNGVSWATMRNLVRIGIPAAMFSAVVVVFNSYYVMIANGMRLGETIGHVVLATNISVMLLFGLNTVSWAMASRTMSRLYLPAGKSASLGATGITDVFLRLGIICAVLIALCAQPTLVWLMPEYAESGQFILYFCLFQSYSLLLFSESSFLNVNSRLVPVLLGYVGVMVLLGLAFMSGRIPYLAIVWLGVTLHFLLAVCIASYARRLGFSEGTFRERLVALAYPVLCMVASLAAGPLGVVAVSVIYLVGNLSVHRDRTVALINALSGGRLARRSAERSQ